MMELISAHRLSLAAALDSLTDDQWRGPSMCAGWTPAHVLAHQTMPFRISELDVLRGVQRSGGDFTKYSDQVAERDSRISPADLVAVLRDNASTSWSPPGGGLAGALTHDLVHGLDITWPLPVEYLIPDQAMTTVLDLAAGTSGESIFGFPVTGIKLTALDLDWSAGDGPEVAGSSRDLLMLLAGRAISRRMFGGEGAAQLTQAVP